MYPSIAQIVTSLSRLAEVHPFFGFAFLGFKKASLPVGSTKSLSYTFIEDEILEKYFKPKNSFDRYFNPFRTTSKWVSNRYVSTSLQRVIADTFGPAFIHTKGSSRWGWQPKYIGILKQLMKKNKSARIPALDIAVWLFRDENLSDENPREELVERLIEEFELTREEMSELFDSLVTGRILELEPKPVTETELLNAIGWPEGSGERTGVTLQSLGLRSVGPVKSLKYKPSGRLNLITGDNSLGKSFLLECAWWAVTGEWASFPAEPSRMWRGPVEIAYTLSSASGRTENFVSPFNLIGGTWQRPESPFNGLGFYSTFDGKIAIWDPARTDSATSKLPSQLRFSKEAIWEGLTLETGYNRKAFVANGLIRDCVAWQTSKRLHAEYSAFTQCLAELSPPDGKPIKLGAPTKIQNDSREIPTVRMPYGDVPIVFASAGIQRILGLAYMLTWTWFEHLNNSRRSDKEPLRQMTVLLDEIEAHLHPRWQRQILPAVIKTLQSLSPQIKTQIHVTSHSPLVLASVEPLFDRDEDRIHQLRIQDRAVIIEEIDFVKHGSINAWLESEVFGLGDARAAPSETAIRMAKELQLSSRPSKSEIEAVNQQLHKLLPDDDPFWVRWNYFYEQAVKGK